MWVVKSAQVMHIKTFKTWAITAFAYDGKLSLFCVFNLKLETSFYIHHWGNIIKQIAYYT